MGESAHRLLRLTERGNERPPSAATLLRRGGYKNVRVLIGGYRSWIQSGQRVITGRRPSREPEAGGDACGFREAEVLAL